MELSVVEEEGVTIVRLEGRMDIKGAEKIDMKFAGIAGVRAKVAVDLSGVDYIASIGIRSFVMAGKSAAQKGNKLVLFGAPELVQKVLTTSGADQIVTLVADWEAAKAALS